MRMSSPLESEKHPMLFLNGKVVGSTMLEGTPCGFPRVRTSVQPSLEETVSDAWKRQAGRNFEPAGFPIEIKGFHAVIRAAPAQGFSNRSLFIGFLLVGLAAVCIVSRQAATSFFHFARKAT